MITKKYLGNPNICVVYLRAVHSISGSGGIDLYRFAETDTAAACKTRSRTLRLIFLQQKIRFEGGVAAVLHCDLGGSCLI